MNKKIIIIGGGVAGLSAGIYARLNGFDTLIVESHSIAGGLCTAWHRKGYRFDYSIQWIVGTRYGAFHDTYIETHAITEETPIINAKYHTRNALPDGQDFLIYTNIEKWQDYMIKNAPEDEKSIRKMCRHMNRCKKLEPFDLAPPLRSPFLYIQALFHSFTTLMTIARFKNKTYQEYIAKLHFKNKWLREFLLKNYQDDDFPAVAFLLILSWYTQENAGYPLGGSLGVAERMTERYKSLGGKFLFQNRVSEIIVKDNQATGVRLANGETIDADYVISASDGHNTIFNLLKGKYISRKTKQAYDNWTPFSSIVQISLGINAKLETRYPVQVILGDRKIGNQKIAHNYRLLNYDFDATMAPEGRTCIIIRFESPYSYWESLSAEDYRKEKELIRQEGIRILEENYPGSSQHIEVCDVATPLTTVRYTGAWQGSYEGFRASSRNITDQLRQTLPGLHNFYMAGHWLFPGGGIPPSIQSGKWSIQLICKKEKRAFNTEG